MATLAMFAVPKYSQALEALRKERNVHGLFQHNLVAVDAKNKIATFKNLAEGAKGAAVQKEFDFLHVVPPQKPWDWVAKSRIGESRVCCVMPCHDRALILTSHVISWFRRLG